MPDGIPYSSMQNETVAFLTFAVSLGDLWLRRVSSVPSMLSNREHQDTSKEASLLLLSFFFVFVFFSSDRTRVCWRSSCILFVLCLSSSSSSDSSFSSSLLLLLLLRVYRIGNNCNHTTTYSFWSMIRVRPVHKSRQSRRAEEKLCTWN